MPDEQKLSKDEFHYSNLENIASLVRQTSVFPDIIRGHTAQANFKTAQSEALAFQKTVTALLTRLQELKGRGGAALLSSSPVYSRFGFLEIKLHALSNKRDELGRLGADRPRKSRRRSVSRGK